MTTLHEQFDSFSNALNSWVDVLEKALAEGITKVEDGYFTANPEWISNAIKVFRSITIPAGPPWAQWRWGLDTLDDHIRNFLDADFTWSETLADSSALIQLTYEIKSLRKHLAISDADLDEKWETEWNWMR